MIMNCERCDGERQILDVLGDLTDCYDCGGHGFACGQEVTYFWQSSAGRQRIAQVMPDGDDWRVTWYDQDGPSYHCHADKPLNELRAAAGWRRSKVAARLLDYWATKPAWRLGCRKMLYVRLWNSLPSKVAADAERGIDGLEDRIAALQTAKAEHCRRARAA
jgi:hypothetical protein